MKNILLILFFGWINVGFGQGFSFVFKALNTPTGVNVRYDENEKSMVTDTFKLDISIYQAITFTNKAGKLLGYFNGHQVRNTDGTLAVNGDSLAWTESLNYRLRVEEYTKGEGLGVFENAVILPTHNDSLYMLFYLDYMYLIDIDNFFLPYMLEAGEYEFTWYSKALLLSHVRVRKDGKLEIVKGKKDIPVIEDFLMYSNLMAVPHANSTDFWILAPCQHENTAYSILVSDTSVVVNGKNYFSDNNTKYIWQGVGTSKFSAAGNKLLRYNYRYGRSDIYPSGYFPHVLEVMNFDRCTGKVYGDSTTDLLDVPWFVTAEFSPTAKYLYIGGIYFLTRCELNKGSYFDRLDTIYKIPYQNLTTFDVFNNYDHSESMNLLPNGHILCHSYWSTPYFHIVSDPDAEDIKDIGYISRAVTLPESPDGSGERIMVGGMPRHVQIKMSPIACTSELTDVPYNHNIKIYPNPVSNFLNVFDTEIISGSGCLYDIIHLASGHIIKSGNFNTNILEVSDLKSGFYGLRINDKMLKFIKL